MKRSSLKKNLDSMRVIAAISLAVFWVWSDAYAGNMQSSTYKIQSDSLNFGGGLSTSTNYTQESTGGEVATGDGTSAGYSLRAGYQAMQETYLAISAAADVTLSPNIGGVAGGTADGTTSFTVTTDNAAGYQLTIKASTSPALKTPTATFQDYLPFGSDPDYTFTVAVNASAFGFTPESTDIATRYKDNGSACNTGSNNATDTCWDGLSTTPVVILRRTSSNHPSGTSATIRFRAKSGSSYIQEEGSYTATTTLTATAL